MIRLVRLQMYFVFIKSQHLGIFSTQQYPRHNLCSSIVGMNTGASLLDGKTDDWGIVFDINVIGTCTVTREIINLMREAVSS